MTGHIDRDEATIKALRAEVRTMRRRISDLAQEVRDERAACLDQIEQVKIRDGRIARFTVQAQVHRRAAIICYERASEAEKRATAWEQQYAHDIAQANADTDQAEKRIGRLENRAASETARANEWRRKHRVMAGKRDAAHRAYMEEMEARRVAETRLQAVQDVLDTWATYCQTEKTMRTLTDIRRALEA